MSAVGQIERITQNRVVRVFTQKLGYRSLGNWEDRSNNRNIEESLLRHYLIEAGYEERLRDKAIFELNKAAGDQSKSLYDVNKEVYSLLRYGVKVKKEAGENTETVHVINWKEPLENHFAIAEEVTVQGEFKKRPDVVLYVNGIALGVLELKRSTVSVSEGIRQNLDNQQNYFIKSFFSTVQLVMAGSDTEGLHYGVVNTPEKYYLHWKEADRDKYGDLLDAEMVKLYDSLAEPLDQQIVQLCDKKRFLELIHDFIVFDRGQKKACRHNQYFGVKAAHAHVRKREGGIIWHTQGSGKSLTMVWLTRWIRENIPDSRVLIITDRDELDEQIEKVYKGVNEEIYRTKSGADLIKRLNDTKPLMMCSLIHKFSRKEEASDADYDSFIEEMRRSLPQNFKAKGDVYVFVDECHRTQSGTLHAAMKNILPNALMIGFTGTPLLKKDKQTSMEIFGRYIHTYKFDQAAKDKVILDLVYEARNIDQHITSQTKIDQWFEAKTRGLTEYARTELKKRWGTMQKVLSSKDRLGKIVADIMFDLETKDRLQNGRGNAMLVSGSIYQACRYYELFQEAGLKKCAIVTSYVPTQRDLKGETTGEDAATDKLTQYEVYQKMLGGKSAEDFEEEVKKKFVEEPAQMKLLIVVDKLLTGFDAPSATYLYIDKSMQDHGLFQAICRVNRLDGEDKEYGFIIDYKDLFKSLASSIHDYTSEAFDGFEKTDVEGLLTDRLKKGKEQLDEALEALKALCEPIEPTTESVDYLHFFSAKNKGDQAELKESEQKRHALYKYTAALIRAYSNIANEMEEAGYTPAGIERIQKAVKHYENVRLEVKIYSGDYIDLKSYEPAMRHLIDTYIGAGESEKISAFDDMTLLQLIVERGAGEAIQSLPKGIRRKEEAVAETIENNMRRVIIDEMPTNPKYFEKMSVLLEELIKERQAEAISYEEYLKKVAEQCKQITQPQTSADYPKTMTSSAKRALYDNLGKNESLSLVMDAEILYVKKDGWKGNPIKEREVKNVLKKHLENPEDLDRIFELVKKQKDY